MGCGGDGGGLAGQVGCQHGGGGVCSSDRLCRELAVLKLNSSEVLTRYLSS